jgi:HD-GYP domain-containing protein (c-di-GMP phosphodiesterase class II)
VLQQVPVFRELAEDAANHHERLDGRGYFRGLRGEDLTTTARLLAVADVTDALMSARPYRAALPVERVVAHLNEGRHTQFCPSCVDAMIAALEKGV